MNSILNQRDIHIFQVLAFTAKAGLLRWHDEACIQAEDCPLKERCVQCAMLAPLTAPKEIGLGWNGTSQVEASMMEVIRV